MERSLEIHTGESVAIRYELAGVGSRFLAVFVDFAIQITAAIIVIIAATLAGILLHHSIVPRVGSAIAVAALSMSIFLLFFGYFIFFETRWNGETPGKRLIGVRVMRDGGFPIDFMGAVIRNLIRTLEFGLGFYAVSAVVMLLSSENKRLGDFAAGTIVVRNLRPPTAPQIRISEENARADFPMLTPADWDRLLRFYIRRPQLDEAASRRIASAIASEIRPKLSADFRTLSDEELLAALHSAVGPVSSVVLSKQPQVARGMEFRPARDEDLSLLQQWAHNAKDAAWLAHATNSACVHIVELDEVPSGCFAHTADNELATEVSIDLFLIDHLRRDSISILEAIKQYIAKIVCVSYPRVERVLVPSPPDDIAIMLALASAGFIRIAGRPLFLNLPKRD